jgi:predicted RNA binding protein YcfA (HicA-like mRNA interferase family)
VKVPRNLTGGDFAKGLIRVGYTETRQRGDHLYMTTQTNGEHHVSIPLHKPLKVGTLSALLSAVAAHLGLDREELLRRMKV